MKRLIIGLALLAATGCEANPIDNGDLIDLDLDPPQHLTYLVEASGDPGHPASVTLRWDNTSDPAVDGWKVYGRDSREGGWSYRGTTTSNSFHDEGQPQLQYQVRAFGGSSESDPSATVTVDERLALTRPATLSSISLNGAVALVWSDESYRSDPDGFWHYRVYSASYDLDRNLCGTSWQLEGTTIAPEFRVGAMPNGVPRCFAVSGISIEGFESLWSPLRNDTPRPDARNVALTVRQGATATAGFRFWRDVNADNVVQTAELGLVGSGGASDIDFAVDRDGAGRIFLTPIRTAATVAVYGNAPIGDLTSIDLAPIGGYSRTAIEALPGWGYVFQLNQTGGTLRYGALRISHVGKDLIIFDWSFQTDVGNPELVVAR